MIGEDQDQVTKTQDIADSIANKDGSEVVDILGDLASVPTGKFSSWLSLTVILWDKLNKSPKHLKEISKNTS